METMIDLKKKSAIVYDRPSLQSANFEVDEVLIGPWTWNSGPGFVNDRVNHSKYFQINIWSFAIKLILHWSTYLLALDAIPELLSLSL